MSGRFEFDRRSTERIAETVLRVERLPHDLRSKHRLDKRRGLSQTWWPGVNSASATIPAYSCVVVGDTTTVDGIKCNALTKPSTTFTRSYGISPTIDVAYSSNARCAFTLEAGLVKYDTGTPAAGETWGPKPGQWTLSKNYPGFRCVGIVDSSAKIMLAVPEETYIYLGKADSSIANAASGTVSVWVGAAGSEVDSTVNITSCYNRGVAISSGNWVSVVYMNGQPYVGKICT